MKLYLSLLFLLLMLPSGAFAENFAYHLAPNTSASLNGEQKAAVLAWFSDAIDHLPSAMKAKLARTIDIEFSSFGDTTALPIPSCKVSSDVKAKPDKRILGQTTKPWDITKANHILIHSGFLPEIMKGSANSTAYDCGHRSMYALALATLLHETSHIYDFANFQSPAFVSEVDACTQQDLSERTDHCNAILSVDRTVSKDPMLMNLMGAVEVGALGAHRLQGQISSVRSPENYEFTNTDEGFAVNMEFFLLDPEYACRRPSIHHVLAKHFGFDPFPNRSCGLNYVFPTSSERLSDKVVNLSDLNPKRLYQADYLFASEGQAIMSKWGHAMIRLAFCSPEHAANPGPECMKDLPYHFVASFRSNVTDTHIDNIKGIEGAYPSQLFILPLIEVMDEYNSRGLRDLVSLPLKLNEEQRNSFLTRTLEMGWEYRGRYFFFDNNCATEAVNLMKGIVDEEALQSIHIVTPLGLYNHLVAAGYADATPLADRSQAIADGYIFPSNMVRLQSAYSKIQATAAGVASVPSLDDYLHKSKASERLALEKMLATKDSSKAGSLASEFFLLEDYINKSTEDGFSIRMANLIYGNTKYAEIADTLNGIKNMQQSLMPAGLASTGYGIAQLADYPADLPAKILRDTNQMITVMAQLKKWIMDNDGADLAEMQAVQSNRKFFASQVQ